MYEASRVAGAIFLLDFYRDSFPGAAGAIAMELAVTTVASLANALHLKGEQIGLASNGVDAADRMRRRGWLAEFTLRREVRSLAPAPPGTEPLRPVTIPTRKGADQLRHILEALGRLEMTNTLRMDQLIEELSGQLRRDATVIPILGRITPAIASVLGELVRRGFTVNAIVVLAEAAMPPDWVQTPDWAALLMGRDVDFRVVAGEESIPGICAEALAR
jgi:hypothetical protein